MLDKNNVPNEHPWEKKRAKGKRHFIIYDGVLGWGMIVAILATVINLVVGSGKMPIWANFIVYPAAGVIYGGMMWNMMEKKYQQYLDNKIDEEEEAMVQKVEPVEMLGKVVYEPFVNKAGRLIEGAGDYFFEMENGKFFIKFYEGKVLVEDIKKHVGQTIKIKGYQTQGLWDATDVNFQSRIGEYVVILELLLEEKEEEMKKNLNEVPEIKKMTGKIVYHPFVNKVGRVIEGMGSLYFEIEGKAYFIKLIESNMLRVDLDEYLGKELTIKGYQAFGLWDTDDPEVQSRVGDYVVILEVL